MILTFQFPHLSIQSFPTIEVPSFTLITGVNGAGKTHLLQAIARNHIQSDIVPNPTEDARFFDWTTLVPNDTGQFQVAAVYSERDQFISWGQQQRQNHRHEIHNWASKYGLISKGRGTTKSLLRLTRDDLGRLVPNPDAADRAWAEINQIAQPAAGEMKRHCRNNPAMTAKLNELQQRFGIGILALDVKDFADAPFGWGQTDVFQQSFAQLFMSYFELKKQNLLRRMDEAEGRTPPVPSLTDEEFLQLYGEEPWFFVNRILADARLDFEIDYPIDHSTTNFIPQLRKTTSGVELQFSELSSGERILMSFAFCLYYSLDTRQILRRPTLLLLDEIDAPLHPSMSRQLMETIQESLVRKQGVSVMLTTHSPSTVAVAPESAVYVMRPDEPGLHKVGKRQAIAVLTAEIPTLSIDFSGRRQTFVESRLDAERFEKLYRFLSPRIGSERSLAFIAVGRKKSTGEDGGGCDSVRRIVNKLADSGNDAVFGLVDWDLANQDQGRIIVLAEGKRYAIENCLLDPLLVGMLAIRTDREWAQNNGLVPSDKGYTDLKNMTDSECQNIIDAVERKVLSLNEEKPFGERQKVEYVGGNKANVSTLYLTMNGHDLEELVKNELPILKKYHKQGELLMNLIDPVIYEASDFTPVEIIEAFQKILEFGTGRVSS